MLEKLSLKAPTGIERIVSENKDIKAIIIKTGIIPVDLPSFFRGVFLLILFLLFLYISRNKARFKKKWNYI